MAGHLRPAFFLSHEAAGMRPTSDASSKSDVLASRSVPTTLLLL